MTIATAHCALNAYGLSPMAHGLFYFEYRGWYSWILNEPGTLKYVTRPYPWSSMPCVNSTPFAFRSATVASMSSQ